MSGGLPTHALLRRPSRYFVKRTRGCRDEGSLEREISRWRKVKTLLASLASHGSQQEISKMAQVRISPPIRSILRNSKGSPSSIPASSGQLIAFYREQLKQSVLNEMLTLLVKKQCIIVVSEGEVGFFSRVFLVPKKSGGFRLVIDFSALNKWLAPVTFTMDTLKVVKEDGSGGDVGDFSGSQRCLSQHSNSSTVSEIPVLPSRRTQFRYLVLPFGLMSVPWAFTEVVKQIKKWTVQLDIILFKYLDDWLNVHESARQCGYLTQVLIRLCTRLGLLVNETKSCQRNP